MIPRRSWFDFPIWSRAHIEAESKTRYFYVSRSLPERRRHDVEVSETCSLHIVHVASLCMLAVWYRSCRTQTSAVPSGTGLVKKEASLWWPARRAVVNLKPQQRSEAIIDHPVAHKNSHDECTKHSKSFIYINFPIGSIPVPQNTWNWRRTVVLVINFTWKYPVWSCQQSLLFPAHRTPWLFVC